MYEAGLIADRIIERAAALKVSVKQVFEIAGMGRNTIAHLRDGSFPKVDNMARIADTLGCSIDYLVGRSDRPEGQ